MPPLILTLSRLVSAKHKGEMNPKPRPNHRLYIEILRNMPPGKRLLKAFELSSFANQLFIHGLKKKHAGISAAELSQIIKDHLHKCHNRNY